MAKPRIGWIGVGVMGSAMAGHLLDSGYALTVYNRTKSKTDNLVAKGAEWAESPADLARSSQIVFTMVGYPADVREVILGEKGVLAGLDSRGIVCDMTTSSPELAREIAVKAMEQDCLALDAPVTGGDIGAREAALSIFVGGNEDAFRQVEPCLEHMGKNIMFCGKAGMGQQAKLANQVAVAGVMFSVCESLLYCLETGLDAQKWLELVIRGAAGSTAMTTLGRRILAGDFAPGFFVNHFVKDLGLCLAECKRMNLVLPGLTMANEFYSMMQAKGMGGEGTQSLAEFLASLSGKSLNGAKNELSSIVE